MGQGWQEHRQQIENRLKRIIKYDYKGNARLVWGSIQESLKEHSTNIKDLSHQLRPILMSPVLWSILILLASLPFFTFLYFYKHYNSIVDQRLKSGFVERTVDVYSRPLILSQKQHLSKEQITNYLKKIGYRPESKELKPGSYRIDRDSVAIMPLESSTSAVKVVYSNKQDQPTIERIIDLNQGGERETFEVPGLLLGSFSDTERSRRHPIEYNQIPKRVIDAILAIEDRRFFEHPGIDFRGIIRAIKVNYKRGEIVQGGSTITQQVIKTTFKMNKRTFHRKFEEAFLALALENRLSKEEIFTLYINEIYLGQQGDIAIRGFAEASRYYFGKDLDQLSLAETAFLAGLIRGPSYYSPQSNPERALTRRNEVLRSMLETGSIQQSEFDQAINVPVKISPPTVVVPEAPHFFDYASLQLQQLQSKLPTYGRFKAIATLDLQLQQLAEDAITKHVDRLRKYRRSRANKLQAALVALNPRTGEVLALVGGRDYSNSSFNRATTAMRQPGSAFKPFVYTAAFSSGRFNPGTMIRDEEQIFVYDGGKEYEPKNYGGKFSGGDVTLREAFARSLNTVTVDLALRVGLDNIANVAERAGLHKPKPYPSMALGTFETTPLELAAAYSVFPNGGQYVSPRSIGPVTGNNGTVLASPPQSVRSVCSPAVAYLMTNMMESVIGEGTARGASWLRSYSAIAGKTGTSTDGWFIGYTPKLVVAVWVGYDTNEDLKLTGGESALPIWEDFVKEALEQHPEMRAPSFQRPSDVIEVRIDADTGYLATDYCVHTRIELVPSGLEPLPCDHSVLAYQPPSYNQNKSEDEDLYSDSDIENEDLFRDTDMSSSDVSYRMRRSSISTSNKNKGRKILTNSDFEKEPDEDEDKDEDEDEDEDEDDK
jgi:penicillin-binding protein 1B